MTSVRREFLFEGRLQGVGFRPLVYRLAHGFELSGWVRNTGRGVSLQLQGLARKIDEFEVRLKNELPKAATIRKLTKTDLILQEELSFQIISSEEHTSGASDLSHCASAEILPDLALCDLCSRELDDPIDRRYRYPFAQCTDCGPRYSILRQLPFDRANTTMSVFPLCDQCRSEYEDPSNRRFHAQTICCADCGPSLCLKNASGQVLFESADALTDAARAIREGLVVAVLGVGGFQLICDAKNNAAVEKLRRSKGRGLKPFALMAPSLDHVRKICEISQYEEQMLLSQGAPIVLLKRAQGHCKLISSSVAPGLGSLGVMLPYSPVHKLLLTDLNIIVVATSGNVSEEPICFQETAAYSRLRGLADFFLVHDRAIASRVDDSVVREIAGTEVVFRAGRGYAPKMLDLDFYEAQSLPEILALGGHHKNSLAFAKGGRLVLMPHIGNLDSHEAALDYERAIDQVVEVQKLSEARLACDLHPEYRSTRAATARSTRAIKVQHHEAHLLSCVAEHGIRGPIFGVAWDGTGYGSNETLWGGEFFTGSHRGFERMAHLRSFRLPGGEAAIQDPRRAALGILFEMNPDEYRRIAGRLGFSKNQTEIFFKVMGSRINSPETSSVGRLFDAVASLLGIGSESCYEGQAATELEFVAQDQPGTDAYSLAISNGPMPTVDWEPLIREILRDLELSVTQAMIAAKFHRSLSRSIVEMARLAGIQQVVLSGGCFQNKILSEGTIASLREEGFSPFWNQCVPPGDGGLSVGQVLGGCNVLVHSR